VAAAAYAKAAREHADYMRARRAEVLNKHGRVLKALKVGDYVKKFIPPSHSEAVRRRRKAKHICQWRGPLRIESKLSNTTFELSSYFNPSKRFRRHLSNVRRWRGPLPTASADDDSILPLVLDVEVGEFAFVRDAPSATILYLAKVMDVNDNTITINAWGSTNKNHVTGKYLPVYILDSNNLPTTKPRNQAAKPWTWKLPTAAVHDLCVLRDVCSLTSGRLDAVS